MSKRPFWFHFRNLFRRSIFYAIWSPFGSTLAHLWPLLAPLGCIWAHKFRYFFDIEFYIDFGMHFGWQLVTKWNQKLLEASSLLARFLKPFMGVDLIMHLGRPFVSLLAYFWLPLAPFWLPLVKTITNKFPYMQYWQT